MDTGQQIKKALRQKGEVKLSGLGRLVLESGHAVLDAGTGKILPPRSKLAFVRDGQVQEENEFSAYAAECLLTVLKEGRVETPNLGTWLRKAGKIEFVPEGEPDLGTAFGMEALSFEALPKKQAGDSLFRKLILWVFLIVVPVAAGIFLVVNYGSKIQDAGFWNDLSVKTSTNRIEKPTVNEPPVQKPDAMAPATDSAATNPLLEQ